MAISQNESICGPGLPSMFNIGRCKEDKYENVIVFSEKQANLYMYSIRFMMSNTFSQYQIFFVG